jgi:hypothetical protein
VRVEKTPQPAAEALSQPQVAAHSPGDALAVRLSGIPSMLLALLIGLFIRAGFLLQGDFPINDGGLFVTMIDDLRAAGYALPAFTSYNGGQIPFAYPPLAFYLVAWIAELGLATPITLVRLLPPALSLLIIPALYLFGRQLGMSRAECGLATLAFALLPASYVWHIMGGGLTRAPSVLAAVLLFVQTHRLYTGRCWRDVPLAILLGCLIVLLHPETVVFALVTVALLWLFYGRHRTGLLQSAVVASGVIVGSAPWWAQVLRQHGLAPFQIVAGTGLHGLDVLIVIMMFRYTAEDLPALFTGIGLCGLFLAIAERRLFLPLWALAILLITPRTGQVYLMLPLALLAAFCLDRLILPALRGTLVADGRPAPVTAARRLAPQLFLIVLIGGALVNTRQSMGNSSLQMLDADDRAAMAWVAANSPLGSRFLVIGAPHWGLDHVAEWFPTLALRQSVATVQGREWLPGFAAQAYLSQDLAACARQEAHCLDEVRREHGLHYDYVYVPGASAYNSLRLSLRQTPGYTLVYDRPGATIFALP